jgi:uncharacterized protein YraI
MAARHLLMASALFGTLAWSAAQAAPGVATGNVNMRTGPGTNYAKITTIPAVASVEVFGCPSWCQVAFAGAQGWVSSNYIATGASGGAYYDAPAPVVIYDRPAMPHRSYWRYGRPWWDDRYDTWYDGHSYWYGDRWYDRPRHSGFSIELGF